MMALFFAQRVVMGKNTFEEIPSVLQKEAAEILIKDGLFEYVPAAFGGTK